MSKVALRVYNRDIEALVDQGHVDEAIAHCQHILKDYPKHLETYRLLGKAHLEGHHFADAADIFQRVLMSVPDDFISQLGMSIISDEQKDLSRAIWHMERAFEVNPSNSGVQGELRRLYGRRDGLEPPKIRLTRGALAQMYTKGAQFQQAIAEIKSVLAEDPSRVEMRVLLARAYFRGGQKVEATELCIELLKQFPYCLDANRILVEALPGTPLAQNLETYKKRVEALDPYAAVVTGSIFDADGVPDNAVSLERLEWDPNAAPAGAFGASSSGNTAEALPDFLKTAGWGPSTGEFKEGPMDMTPDEPEAGSSGELAAAQIPDWLKAMAPPPSTPSAPEQATAAGEPELASADLDWLAGLGGPVAAAGAEQPPAAAQPDWMKDMGAATPATPATPPVEPAGTPDWLKDVGSAAPTDQSVAPQAATPAETPDWLSGLGNSAPAEQAPAAQPNGPAETPDWLSGLGNSAPVTQASAAQPNSPAETPDWLKGLGSSAPAEQASAAQPQVGGSDETPDWLKDLAGAPAAAGPAAPAGESTDTPDWLQGLSGAPGTPAAQPAEAPQPVASAPASPAASGDDDNLDWLKSLGGMQDTPASQTQSSPTPKPEAHVNKDLSGDEEDIPPMTAPVSGPGTSASEQDDAMKWLESLAQKQGAKAEELITNPNERTETAPDWVARVDEAAGAAKPNVPAAPSAPPAKPVPDVPASIDEDAPLGELSPLTSGPGTTASEQDDAMKWLESLAQKQGAKAEELITNPNERTETAPGWVEQMDQPASNMPAAPAPATPAPVPAASEPDDSMKWLESLTGSSDAKAAELSDAGDQPADQAPAWVTQPDTGSTATPAAAPANEQDDTMAWLQSLASGQPSQEPPAEAPAPAPPSTPWEPEVPATGTAAQPAAAETPAAPVADVSDWLKSLDSPETSQPATSAPDPSLTSTQKLADVPYTPPPAVPAQPAAPPAEQVPDWLSNMRPPAEQGQPAQDDLPDWLKDQSADDQIPSPVPAPGWIPAEPPIPSPQLAVMEPPTTPAPAVQPPAQAAPATPPAPASSATPVVPPAQAAPATPPPAASAESTPAPAAPRPTVRETGVLGDKDGPALQKARDLLAHGGLDAAVSEYAKLVKRGKLLEEVIFDLKEATYSHPVDVVIWQTLGDAHMRANQLQEALDAYTKAEELLR